MNKKLIKNYTTDIPIEKTISEIQTLLANNGATGIMFEYGEAGKVKNIFFRIKYKNKELPFRLPSKPENVYNALFGKMIGEQRYGEERRFKSEKIAWRVCKDWLEAQLTHINLEQAEPQEVFLPYLVMPNNKTLYESMEETEFALPSGQ